MSFDPFSAISAGAGILGTAIGAGGQVRQGEVQAAEARYGAQVAANNQIIANQNAQYALRAGSEATYQTGLRERAKAGDITAGFAAHGIDVNTGSAAEVRRSQAQLGEQAEETTAQGAQLTAYGYRTQAASFGAQQQLLTAEAPMDVTGGILGGAGTALAGVGNLPQKWGNLFGGSSSGGVPQMTTEQALSYP